MASESARITDYAQLELGKTHTVVGWATAVREQKKRSFVEIRVGTAPPLQIIIDRSLGRVATGSFIEVAGLVKALPAGATAARPFEMEATGLTVLGECPSDYPSICPPGSSQEIALERRHFHLRDPHFALITKARAQMLQAIRRYYDKAGYTEIIPPVFTGTECEGGATLFKLAHPGHSTKTPMEACLTQSSQFALEMALPGVGACYCAYPSFRAESSHTRRHLTEFMHVEHEIADVRTLEEHAAHLKALLEGCIRHFISCAEETLTALGLLERVKGLYEMTKDIVMLDHADAVQMLVEQQVKKDDGTDFTVRDDIPEAQERALIDRIGKIVFLCRFPVEHKSFYMALDPHDPTRVLGIDVEVPGVGEIIGSGVREADYDRLLARMHQAGLKPEDYTEYLDLRRYGFGQTAGMGMGLDRLLTWLLGLKSIREVATFPRYPGYLRP